MCSTHSAGSLGGPLWANAPEQFVLSSLLMGELAEAANEGDSASTEGRNSVKVGMGVDRSVQHWVDDALVNVLSGSRDLILQTSGQQLEGVKRDRNSPKTTEFDKN